MKKAITLTQKWSTEVKPKPPFNFDGSIYHPAHFPTPTEEYQPGKWWQTMRFLGIPLGIKMENQGTTNKPKIKLTIYSQKPLRKDFKERLVEEIKYRFELNLDLSKFNQKFKNDKILGPVLKKWLGRRSKCGYSLYESLMIYIVLQNATVRRTIQMMNALLEKYGDKVKFDNKEFWVFWTPEKLARASEKELRNLKVGYRAKSLKRISESFAKGEFDEKKLRKKSPEELKKELIKLYGIGPNSASYMLFEVFHNHEIFDVLPPWEQKIYSKLLYNKPLVPVKKILSDINKRWGKWKRLAADYVWHDLFWRHQQEPIDWLEREIRR